MNQASKSKPPVGCVGAAEGADVAPKGSNAEAGGAVEGRAGAGAGAGAPKGSPGVGGATLGANFTGLGGLGGLGGLLLKGSKGAGGGGACPDDPNGSEDVLLLLPPPPPPFPKGSNPFEPPEEGTAKGSPKLLEFP